MLKLKTRKAVRNRFKVTGTKQVIASKTKRRHLLGDRNPSKKRQFRRKWTLSTMNRKRIIKALPYD